MNSPRHIAWNIGILLLLIAGSAAKPEDSAPAESAEELETRIQKIPDDTRTLGMIGAIVYGNGVVWQGALGVAVLETQRDVAPSSLAAGHANGLLQHRAVHCRPGGCFSLFGGWVQKGARPKVMQSFRVRSALCRYCIACANGCSLRPAELIEFG